MDNLALTNRTYRAVDTGLGTTYERYALNRVLARLCKEFSFQTVLEGPDDGMTGIPGINSLFFGLNNIDVSLALVDSVQAEISNLTWSYYLPKEKRPKIEIGNLYQLSQFPSASYDLVWNFNVIACHPEPFELLNQMVRVSKKWILFFGLNSENYSFPLHALHHRVAHQDWDHGPVNLLSPKLWVKHCSELGLSVREVIHVDCPWWPDIVDFGQLISDFFPFLHNAANRARPQNRFCWRADQLPYFNMSQHQGLAKKLTHLSLFENCGINLVKRKFAHHFGILVEK